MALDPYKVYVVVDREFGEQPSELEKGAPVWIVKTPNNKAVVQRFWDERPREGHLTGITAFKDLASSSPEEMLLGHLETIELHRGPLSADPPYTAIEVLSTGLSAKVKNQLSECGFNEFHLASAGFKASRPRPSG